MTGLVYKDILVLRRQLAYYLAFIVLYAVLAVAGVLPSAVLPGLAVMMSIMLPLSSAAYDDQARWNKFAAATPAGRSGVVTAKYLFALLCIAVSSGLTGVLSVALSRLGLLDGTPRELLLILMACIGAALLLNAVLLPLLLKFGAEKSRIITTLLFLILFGGGLGLGQLAKNAALPAPPPWLLSALPPALGIVAVGGFLLSYCIAQAIYREKEL